jgi:hypothetical protein
VVTVRRYNFWDWKQRRFSFVRVQRKSARGNNPKVITTNQSVLKFLTMSCVKIISRRQLAVNTYVNISYEIRYVPKCRNKILKLQLKVMFGCRSSIAY